uniref:Glucose-6-phosphate isomerase n=1 Tax=Percolomonas cosmopolitus TaxID=63605 RepID=A0A7S1KUP0_9EUKA
MSSTNPLFFDSNTQFSLDLRSFFPSIQWSKWDYAWKRVLESIDNIESGKIVNQTSVKEESENRCVDHYNLRHHKEIVPQKSLQKSIAYWKEIQVKIGKITSGEAKNEFGDEYTDVVFNGIGGSFLGPLMMIVFMHGDSYNFNSGLGVRIHFLSNSDADTLSALLAKINVKTSILINMSKSGSTAETKGNMDAFNANLKQQKLDIGHHNIAITTPGSNFDKFAQENKYMHIFYMNNETGGRTSVGSAIGAVPAAVAGIDFEAFLRGQSAMDELTRRRDPQQNPAMLMAAAIQTLTLKEGRKNMIVLGYSDYLKEFAHYLQQLYMESIGKEYDVNGTPNPEGLTVFGGVGTGEQHAFMQQVQKGFPDCFVRFVHFQKRGSDVSLSGPGSMGRQLLAFVKGTEQALQDNGKSFMTCTFEKRDMFNLGMMIALEERIVTILAALRNLNAYDQPGVQDGKLAATEVNKISNTIEGVLEQKLSDKNWKFEGTAEQARTSFILPKDSNLRYVEAILNDIVSNVDVPHAYPKLHKRLSASKSFKEEEFHFTLRSEINSKL